MAAGRGRMVGQTLFLLALGAVQILGAPTKDLSGTSGDDASLSEGKVSHKEGRGIPLFIYDDGTGTSNLAPAAAEEAVRRSGNSETTDWESSLIRNLMSPQSFMPETPANLRKFGGLQFPGLQGLGTPLINPDFTFPGLAQTSLFPGLQNFINMFPSLGNFSAFNQMKKLQNLTNSGQRVFLYNPITGLIPINNLKTKAARGEFDQSSALELLHNVYNTYGQSLLQQQSLASQKQSLYGSPWQSLFPFNPQAYNLSPFNQLPNNQPSFGPLPYFSSIPYFPANNPFPNLAVQLPTYPSAPLNSVISESSFLLLKEEPLAELLEQQSEKNKSGVDQLGPKTTEPAIDEQNTDVPVTAQQGHPNMNAEKEAAVNVSNQRDTERDLSGPNPISGNNHPSQVRENSKFPHKLPRSEDNFAFRDSVKRATGVQRQDSSTVSRVPLINLYTLNRSL